MTTKIKKAPKRPPGANTQRLIDKLDEFHETVVEIQEDVERIKPHSAWKRFAGHFVQGIVRGVGFVLGTTVLAGLFILLIQQALRTDVVQTWISDQLSQVVEESVDNALEDTIGGIIQQF